MAIFRGVGGSGDSSDNSFLQEVTAQATTATTKANEASASATSAANSLATIQNTEVTSAAFNTGDGVLTLTKLGGATVTADLDGRFLTTHQDITGKANLSGANFTGDVRIADDEELRFGTSNDLRIYHSSSTNSSYIREQGTGSFFVQGNNLNLTNTAGAHYLLGISGGQTNLYYDGSTKLNTIDAGIYVTGDITLTGTVDGRDVLADGTKLDGIEANATADQTGAEIKSAYEAVADTNAFTDAEKTKLSGIEASADVTDTTNVTAAGALMDSEVTNLAQVKAFDSSDYATAAQGSTADSALQNLVEDTSPQLGGDLDLNGNDITGTGNISADTFTGGDTVLTQTGILTNDAVLTLRSTDSSNIGAPHLLFDRVSSSPAANDGIGNIVFQGRDSTNQSTPYVTIVGKADDVTNTTEDGQLQIYARKAGGNTLLFDLTSTKLTLDNGTGLDVDGGITVGGTVNQNQTTTFGGNIAFANNTHLMTVDGRDVSVDGARLDTIPYHRVKHTQLRANNTALHLSTAYNNVGLYDTIQHPATPVECARYLDLDIAIKWFYVNTNTNDLYLQLHMTVPAGGGTIYNMGTATRESVNNPEYNTYGNFAWYYVSGDYTHLFTEFGRINTGTGTSEGLFVAWEYDSVNNRTYMMSYSNPGVSFNTGDTFYYSPYAFESAGTALIVTKEIDERYVSSGVQPHSFKFKTSYDDAALSYKLQMKELNSGDSGQVLETKVTLTDVEEI